MTPVTRTRYSPATAARKAPEEALGALPEWDLSDLYPGRDSPQLAKDQEALERDAKAFRERYFEKLAGLDGKTLGAAIAEYEKIEERLGRMSSFAELTYAGN